MKAWHDDECPYANTRVDPASPMPSDCVCVPVPAAPEADSTPTNPMRPVSIEDVHGYPSRGSAATPRPFNRVRIAYNGDVTATRVELCATMTEVHDARRIDSATVLKPAIDLHCSTCGSDPGVLCIEMHDIPVQAISLLAEPHGSKLVLVVGELDVEVVADCEMRPGALEELKRSAKAWTDKRTLKTREEIVCALKRETENHRRNAIAGERELIEQFGERLSTRTMEVRQGEKMELKVRARYEPQVGDRVSFVDDDDEVAYGAIVGWSPHGTITLWRVQTTPGVELSLPACSLTHLPVTQMDLADDFAQPTPSAEADRTQLDLAGRFAALMQERFGGEWDSMDYQLKLEILTELVRVAAEAR